MNKYFKPTGLVALVLLTSVMALAACGGGGPEDREFDLEIKDRKLILEPAVIMVNRGDNVTLRVDADEHATFHLHGYDIEIAVGPDDTTTMEFTADATGKFKIVFHPGGGQEQVESEERTNDEHDEDEGEEITIGSLEVQP